MTVKVNDSCIGCGACESICDAVFSVDGVAQVDESAVADNMDSLKKLQMLAQYQQLKLNN